MSREPLAILVRLIVAMLLGAVVAFIYRRTRYASQTTSSFTVTLVLLAILIAMVTQVIGDNVARAFSLVGALSIVRFRTVVRDTQDTAYVIFAVAVGMAVGAAHPWLAVGAIGVIGFAAYVMRERSAGTALAAGRGFLRPPGAGRRRQRSEQPARHRRSTPTCAAGGCRQWRRRGRGSRSTSPTRRSCSSDDVAGDLVKALEPA